MLDDEVEVAELVAEVLSRDGHDVAVAHSGAEGLSRISERDFDIVLSDFRMPNIDGQGLFNELERSRPDMIRRLGFMTGDKLSADVSASLQRAGRPHIEKPILPDDLRDLIRRVIDDGGRKP